MGRWLSVDPMAEKYPAWSPYNYVMNNPCNKFDPDGKEPCCDYVSQNNGAYREIKTAPAQPSRFYLGGISDSNKPKYMTKKG
ncbi:MAG: hypothetical protein JNN12_11540 [Bacteroidetes Order II. Incertae sedis bacterium]|nr:hypothetical protein [Bacteroidetes Order II. bacterium]